MKCPSCELEITGARRICAHHGDEGECAIEDSELRGQVLQCPQCGTLCFLPKEGGDLRPATDDEVRKLPQEVRELLRNTTCAALGVMMGGEKYELRGACPVCSISITNGGGQVREQHIAVCFNCGAALRIEKIDTSGLVTLRPITEEEWAKVPAHIRRIYTHAVRLSRQVSGQRQQ